MCLVGSVVLYFFFFKQKTAYEMRISDWSSDVCSSDLQRHLIVHDWDVYCALDSFIVEVAVGQSAIAAEIIVRSPRGHEHCPANGIPAEQGALRSLQHLNIG